MSLWGLNSTHFIHRENNSCLNPPNANWAKELTHAVTTNPREAVTVHALSLVLTVGANIN